MKILFLLVLLSSSVFAKECFIIQEQGKILKSEGSCETAYAPHSTFKIALSLMGFDSGILVDELTPNFPFLREYSAGINVCKGSHNPRTWMRDSCVWFSQVLTKKLGFEKFRNYISAFDYGNQDSSGDPGKNNGLTRAWLNSSLRISPREQAKFLQRLIDGKLPVNPKARELSKKILFVQELPGGWRLYGKTGNGHYQGELQQGWFVGWIEKGHRKIVFVQHLVDESKVSTYASFRARNEAVTKLWYLIDELEK